MRAVRFTHTSTIVAEAHCETTWNAPGIGTPGTATITIPRTSPAADPAYIDSNGLSLIEVLDEGGCGAWSGVAMDPEFTEHEIRIPAVQTWGILQHRVIQRTGAIAHTSPGYIVSEALRASIGGVGTVQLAYGADGDAPDVREIEIDGRDPWSVLVEMMQLSGSDIHIDESGGIHWCGQLANATRHNTLLVAGGNFHDVTAKPEGRQRVQEVVASSGKHRYVAQQSTGPEMAAWPAQAAISVDASADVLVVAAHAELDQRNTPSLTIEGSVGPALWGIRERDYIKCLVSWSGFAGISRYGRVLSRTLNDDDDLMKLTLQAMVPVAGNVQTAGAGARVKPPQRPGMGREGGSFAQQWRAARRRLAQMEWGT